MEKYHKTDICPIEKENERDETYEAGNPQIDNESTNNNYHIIKRSESYMKYINRRLAEENKRPRKDAVLMCSFVIGSDRVFFKGLSQREEERFFKDATQYFADKYGTENIISAVVHKDEMTPHLHLNLIPLSDGKLCAKDLFCPKNLRALQTEFHETVGKNYHLERGKINSQAEHLSTAEFKAKKIIERAKTENEQLTKANAAAKQRFDETLQEISRAKDERDKLITEREKEADYSKALEDAKKGNVAHGKRGLKDQVIALTVENQRLQEDNARLVKDNDDLFNQYQKAKGYEYKAETAKNAILAVRQHEPEAYARTFFKATSAMQSFINLFSAPIPLPRNRLKEIEQEIEWEKRQEQNKSHPNNNYSSK